MGMLSGFVGTTHYECFAICWWCRSQLEELRLASFLDVTRDEALPRCLEALSKVPNDEGQGSSTGCTGFDDRLKRMELSELSQVPFKGNVALHELMMELSGGLWAKFYEDTTI